MKSFDILFPNKRRVTQYASFVVILWLGLLFFDLAKLKKLKLKTKHKHYERIKKRKKSSNERLSKWSADYNKYTDDNNFQDLWAGRLSPEIDKSIEAQLSLGLREYKVHLVISHCDKPINWIRDSFIPPGVEFNSVQIYSKCGNEVEGAKKGDVIIKLPNHGRCDHSNAHHLSRMNYSNYDDDDIIVFFKDNNYRIDGARSWDSMIRMVIFNGFSCVERTEGPMDFDIYSYSHIHRYTSLSYFKLQAYIREDQRDNAHEFKSNYANLGDFVSKLQLNITQPFISVCYGGLFASNIARIKKQKDAWPIIEKSLSRGDNIEEGHFVERLWAGLLSKPLSPHAIKILEKKTCHCDCRDKELVGEFGFVNDHCGALCKISEPALLKIIAHSTISSVIKLYVICLAFTLFKKLRSFKLKFKNQKRKHAVFHKV